MPFPSRLFGRRLVDQRFAKFPYPEVCITEVEADLEDAILGPRTTVADSEGRNIRNVPGLRVGSLNSIIFFSTGAFKRVQQPGPPRVRCIPPCGAFEGPPGDCPSPLVAFGLAVVEETGTVDDGFVFNLMTDRFPGPRLLLSLRDLAEISWGVVFRYRPGDSGF